MNIVHNNNKNIDNITFIPSIKKIPFEKEIYNSKMLKKVLDLKEHEKVIYN